MIVQVLGLLLLLLYFCQLCTGVLVHIYKSSSYPKRHPPQSYAHAIFGLLIFGLAFAEVRFYLFDRPPGVDSK